MPDSESTGGEHTSDAVPGETRCAGLKSVCASCQHSSCSKVGSSCYPGDGRCEVLKLKGSATGNEKEQLHVRKAGYNKECEAVDRETLRCRRDVVPGRVKGAA